MTRLAEDGVPKEFRGLRGVLQFNLRKFQTYSRGAKVLFALTLITWVSILTWLWMDGRGKSQTAFDAECKAKCNPLPHRLEVTLLNTFIGHDQRRNVRNTRCVCGTAP